MAVQIQSGQPVVVILQQAFERAGLVRSAIDARFNLTDQEFRVEEGLVVLGPLPSDDLLSPLIEALERSGLVYFDDFFDLSGNWPEWLSLYVRGERGRAG
ncbi:MAG TPA: hypothetical protein VGN73_02745 [Gemmatimonadaceae bacterium]|jgi:hypothetical protein|nr:hypothetical protein [Gemmatimonadaceae bacterium]